MANGMDRWLAYFGVCLVLGCGGKAVTTGGASSSAGDTTGSGGTGVTGSGGSPSTPGSGGTAVGGSMTDPPDDGPPRPRDPPPDVPPDPEPPDMPPDMPPDIPPDTPPDMPPDNPTDPPDDPMLPGDCRSDYRTVEQGWCEIQLQCSQRFSWISCEGDGTSAYCYCEGDRYWGDFMVTGVESGQACDAIAPFCVGGVQPDLGELTCEPSFQDVGSDYCSSQAECTRVAELSDEVTVEVRDSRYVWCQANGSAWTCDCNSNFDSVRFDFEDATSNVCSSALDLCIDGNVDASGPRDCTPSSQSASQDYCDAQLDCVQGGSLGGTSVQVHSSVWMSCQPLSNGEWRCDCQLDSGAVTFTLEGDDVWTTCQDAAAMCAEEASG